MVNAEIDRPWMDARLSADERATLLEADLHEYERRQLLHSRWAAGLIPGMPVPDGAIAGAGYVPPIDRLGVPGLYETDASLGVTNPREARPGDRATALPSGLALASTWDKALAFEAGAAIGDETAKKGFNVLLTGGLNLARDPRCGRNFEYLGEDPLLAGVLGGASIAGAQSQGIIATAKHFVLNDQETGRHVANAVIDEAALRESDLLAFQIAIEQGAPGAIMSAYNKVNGHYASENDALLNGVLKGDWAYPGFVMADWGGTVSVEAAKAGLDQQSGEQLDYKVWFDAPLREAQDIGRLSTERVSDMARRILRSMFAAGLFDRPLPVGETIDVDAHALVAQRTAESGIVLLKNEGSLLPIAATAGTIAVIGGNADVGVVSGGGSSQVTTWPGNAAFIHVGGEGAMMAMASEAYHPSSPLRALKARAGDAEIRFSNGRYASEAAALAGQADIAIVFATQWMTEGADAPDLTLPSGQDALIAAVAGANPRTIVVLQTGGAILMPWLDQVGAVVQAWYPGMRGGEAIVDVLFGDVNPSGRLPVTFPASLEQLPRPSMPGLGQRWAGPGGAAVDLSKAKGFDISHDEGSDVGYRWFARQGHAPLFAFGFGLSYSTFAYSDLTLDDQEGLRIRFTIENTGDRSGADIAQVYLVRRGETAMRRLLGWARAELASGDTTECEVAVDPRLLADFDAEIRRWKIPNGHYEIALGRSAEDLTQRATIALSERDLAP